MPTKILLFFFLIFFKIIFAALLALVGAFSLKIFPASSGVSALPNMVDPGSKFLNLEAENIFVPM